MIRKLQLLAFSIVSFGNALICKVNWMAHPNGMLSILCWFFAAVSILSTWKLLKALEGK